MSERAQMSFKSEAALKSPKMYAVIIYNDDYTTMEFVIEILEKIFHKSSSEASALMLEVHNAGKSAVGTYTYDVAVTKKIQADQAASEKGFPLKITVDEAM